MFDLTVLPQVVVHKKEVHGTPAATVDFPNGYSASIVRHPYSYGGKEGKYELAVMIDNLITYDTPITNDVLGYLSEQDVLDTCELIGELPSIKE